VTSENSEELPPFYSSPVPVTPERHGISRISMNQSYEFTRNTGAVPIILSEFAQIARHYPIVFTQGPSPRPLAIFSGAPATNPFLEQSGNWRDGCYVPAYVRRYPFIFAADEKPGQYRLFVDDAAEQMAETEGEPLFEDGEPSGFLKSALEFCTAYQKGSEAVLEFSEEAAQQGLLQPATVTITRESTNSESQKIAGFQTIDRAKIQDMNDEITVQWHRRGWLDAVCLHTFSLQNWPEIAEAP
jgi:hypothetical protein